MGSGGHRMIAAPPGQRRRQRRRRRNPSAPAAAAASPCAPYTAAGPPPPPPWPPPVPQPSALQCPLHGASPPAPRPRTASGLLPADTTAFCAHACSRSRVAAFVFTAFHRKSSAVTSWRCYWCLYVFFWAASCVYCGLLHSRVYSRRKVAASEPAASQRAIGVVSS